MQTAKAPAGNAPRPHQQRIDKPWGWEILWAETNRYCGKLLHIKAGNRISLQYHDQKLETQCLIHGRAILLISSNGGELIEIEMEPGKGYTIEPFQHHRLIALEDADVVEVSTPERGTTFRIADDFARLDETEEARRRYRRGAGDEPAPDGARA
jgi:mannose-6-phosphate isomerase-like protein (cupin superfamily)